MQKQYVSYGMGTAYDLGPLRPPQHAKRACGVLRGLHAPPRHVCALNGHGMAPVSRSAVLEWKKPLPPHNSHITPWTKFYLILYVEIIKLKILPATLAQLAERLTRNEQVVGSNPTGGSVYR